MTLWHMHIQQLGAPGFLYFQLSISLFYLDLSMIAATLYSSAKLWYLRFGENVHYRAFPNWISFQQTAETGTFNKSVPRGAAYVLHDKLKHATMYISNICYAAMSIVST